MEDKMITSQSETIGVAEVRNLMEMVKTLGTALTPTEYGQIALVFNFAIQRLLTENGEEI